MIKKMVLYAIFSWRTRSGRDKGINMARIPSIISNRREEVRKLSTAGVTADLDPPGPYPLADLDPPPPQLNIPFS